MVVHAARPTQGKSEGHKARFVLPPLFFFATGRPPLPGASALTRGLSLQLMPELGVGGSTARPRGPNTRVPLGAHPYGCHSKLRPRRGTAPRAARPPARPAPPRPRYQPKMAAAAAAESAAGSDTSAPRCESKMAAAAGQPCGTAPAGEGRGGFP